MITNSRPNIPQEIYQEEKAYKNTRKAFKEAESRRDNLLVSLFRKRVIFSLPVLHHRVTYRMPCLDQILKEKKTVLSFEISSAEASYSFGRGVLPPEPSNPYFIGETASGVFIGIFEGHLGEEIAIFARDYFQEHYEEAFAQQKPYLALQTLFQATNHAIYQRNPFYIDGATTISCYIEKKTHAIYTATLGDIQAAIFCKEDSSPDLGYIPLSCVRDWSYPKEQQRALAEFCEDPSILSNLEECFYWTQDPKELEVGRDRLAVTSSRSFGHLHLRSISKKPKISINQVCSGDVVVLGSSGLWDFLSPAEIAHEISSHNKDLTLGQRIVTASSKIGTRDITNISVITIEIKDVTTLSTPTDG